MANFGDRIIVLIDMDCFFCQVETKLKPEYKGKPLAVVQYNLWRSGGIIAVNYEAREFGVTRHMRGDEAKEKCPDIVLAIVPSLRGKADTSRYRTAGRSVIEVLKSHCNIIERASVDEAYLDITQLVDKRMSSSPFITTNLAELLNHSYVVGYSEVGSNDEDQRKKGIDEWLKNIEETNDLQSQRLAVAGQIVEEIRADIFAKTEYRCSAGISYNKILAKLACGLHKPNRQTILPFSAVPTLYSTLPVKKVRNLGGKFGDIVIESLKCNVMADLLQYSLQYLQNRFDEKTGLWLYNIARGIDNEPVTTRLVSKSIGACKKFPGKQALTTIESLKHWLGELSAEVCERLEQDNEENERRATLLTVSYQYCQNKNMISQSKSLPLNSYKQEKMQNQCLSVISKIRQPITFLGISAAKFVRAQNSGNFVNFFKCKKSDEPDTSNCEKSNTDETQDLVENTEESRSEINEIQTSDSEDQNKSSDASKSNNITSFFKTVNKIDCPQREPDDVVEEVLTKAEKLKKSFFANIMKANCSKMSNESSIDNLNSSANDCECLMVECENVEEPVKQTSKNSEELSIQSEEDKVPVKLQDIFPDLDNIDAEVLSCLPLQLQKEAALLVNNKKPEKKSPVAGRPKSGKGKLQKHTKHEGKSINSFFIKTGESGELESNYEKCEQCGQMICVNKLDEHKDYHVAQSLQKNINKSIMNEELEDKEKSSPAKCTSKKRSISDVQFVSSKKKTLDSFFT